MTGERVHCAEWPDALSERGEAHDEDWQQHLCRIGDECPRRRIVRLREERGPAERAGKQVDKAVEKVGEQVEKAGQQIQDAAKDAKK